MNGMLVHRGPDQEGYHLDTTVRLGVRRLSVQDIAGGSQPIYNEDRSVVVIFNGEIYNFKELRAGLVARGHRFASRCDTEVIVHLYEELGTGCLELLNGQFAFVLWDAKARRLFAARDRVGKKPLFYARLGDHLVFASEIKSILMHPLARRQVDLRCLDQVFTFFMPVNPRTMFKDIASLPPGTSIELHNGVVKTTRYWEPPVPALQDVPARSDEDWIDELRSLMTAAVSDRLVADVPVGVFLSGGLDSSIIAAVAARCSPTPVQTYSIAHNDPYYDEGCHSDLVARSLKTRHRRLTVSADDIAALLPTLVWRVEAPSCKTSNAAYIQLYKMARETSTVILTGEGADETFGGYPNVRMLKVQDFCRRHPNLPGAARLMERVIPHGSTLRVMYHEPAPLSSEDETVVRRRFGCIPADLQRFRSLASLKSRLFSQATLEELKDFSAEQEVADTLVNRDLIANRHYIQQSQYFEYLFKLPNYLLINPGDRAAMTHSVENRCPFLDRRLIEFSMQLPLRLRVRALTEKVHPAEGLRRLASR